MPRPARHPALQPRAVHEPGPTRRRLLAIPIVLALTTGLWLTLMAPAEQRAGALVASGTVEADEVLIASEVMGRIVELVPEGIQVRSGDVVARLDDSLLQLQLRQAVDNPVQQQLLAQQAQHYVLRAPASGVVNRVPSHVGEIASPGQTVLAITDLANLKLTVYVLQRDLDRVQIGQSVTVTADPYGSRTFSGVVTSTNPRAEFTPRNVQTQRDRLNLVFGVQVRVDNPDMALKPGMPVDATFAPL